MRYEERGPEAHDPRPYDHAGLALTGPLASLVDEIERLTQDAADAVSVEERRAIEKARNVLRTRRRAIERGLGIPERPDDPEEEEEPDPIIPLRLGKKRYATYRETLLTVCGWCAYCGKRIDDAADASLDHIIPKARGGGNEPANLALSCPGCNGSKGSDDPAAWAFRIITATNTPGQVEDLLARLAAFVDRPADDQPAVLAFPAAPIGGAA